MKVHSDGKAAGGVRVNHITLEMLGLSASVNQMIAAETNDWFEYPGYFRSKAHCQLDLFTRGAGEKFTVAIATEIKENDGLSVTNAIQYIAATICKQYNLQPKDLIMIEHYGKDRVLGERYSLVRFKHTRHDREGWHFEDPDWFHLEKTEIERLIGLELYIPNESAYE